MGTGVLCVIVIAAIILLGSCIIFAAAKVGFMKALIGFFVAAVLVSSYLGFKLGSMVSDDMVAKYHEYKEIIEQHQEELEIVIEEE